MSPATIEPAQLLAAIAGGDQRALEMLYRAWSAKVKVFVRAQLHGSELDAHAIADEVTVDVFHDIWRAPQRYDGRVSFSTWLLTIARNKAIDRLRRHGRRAASEDSIDSDGFDLATLDVNGHAPGPQARHEAVQRQHAVLKCLQGLRNPLQRESLTLWALDELSIGEIARIQSAPEGTVKTRLFHGRSHLRQCMERWFVKEGGRDEQ